MAEEGVDIERCNLVIRYDGVRDVRGLIQSRGRARDADSIFLVLTDAAGANDMKVRLEQLVRDESNLGDALLRMNDYSFSLATDLQVRLEHHRTSGARLFCETDAVETLTKFFGDQGEIDPKPKFSIVMTSGAFAFSKGKHCRMLCPR